MPEGGGGDKEEIMDKSWNKYIRSVKHILALVENVTPESLARDLLKTNLILCNNALLEAKRMNWGSHVHEGKRTECILKYMYSEIKKKQLSVSYDGFLEMCKTRQHLCDIMWQAEHHL